MIEQLRGDIDGVAFEDILHYLDNPVSEIEYIIVVMLGNDLAEIAAIAIGGDILAWNNLMKARQVNFIFKPGTKPTAESEKIIFDRTSIPPKEYVDCLYVTPGYFIRRRITA